ncbi:hypothetical protein SDC9_162567 [bioreactor metagenome]|uniref:Uncharacterized protein n=1 Tax=bioreactor metagenome TaxID=1076179 RepID=A0A645FLE9_9ZZZZ
MVGGHGDHEGLRLQRLDDQAARVVDRAHHQRQIGAAAAQVLQLARGGLGRQVQAYSGVALLELLEHGGQHVQRRTGNE